MLRYVRAMSNDAMNTPLDTDPLNALGAELARGDQALAGVAPVLVHLLAQPGQALVSDQTVAQLRGMTDNLAAQLLENLAVSPAEKADVQHALCNRLSGNTQLLSHCYALSVEAQVGQRLQRDLHIDQVLSPLLQELIASDDEELAELAMMAMAAQARFVQAQTRMTLPVEELPAELFRQALKASHETLTEHGVETAKAADSQLKDRFDEGKGRIALFTRVVTALRGAAGAALNLEHGGLALFATALASLTQQPRELAVLGCTERQHARLAFGLRAASLSAEHVERALAIVHPQIDLPASFANLSSQAAKAMLGKSVAGTAR